MPVLTASGRALSPLLCCSCLQGSYSGSPAPPPPPARPQQFGRLFVLNAGEHPVLKITLQVCVYEERVGGGAREMRGGGMWCGYLFL